MRRKNSGIRKRCGCAKGKWPKCGHPWHMNFKHEGVHYRLSLDREMGHPIESKSEAQAAAEEIRTKIRTGTFRAATPPSAQNPVVTFSAFADIWKERQGSRLVRAKDNDYRLGTICAFPLPGKLSIGETPLMGLTADDIEAFRDSRRAQGLSPVTVNHDLKLLRKMLNWGIRKGYLERTPFKIGTEAAISLEREIPRNWRFASEEDEDKLLKAANPHLRAILVALLDTACRLGEVLSLQWRDVNMTRKELTIRAEKAKTHTARLVPISTRLLALLEMRKLGPDGKDFPPEAFVFGDETGAQVKSIRTAWENTRTAAGLPDLHLHDLRHEAGSRFDEAGVPVSYVSKILGHTNLSTTSRYLNIHQRGLQEAMRKLEEHRPAVAQPLHTDAADAPANVTGPSEQPASEHTTIQ